MSLVAGLDLGGSSVKAWVCDASAPGRVIASVTVAAPVLRPAPHRVEFAPGEWEVVCRTALADAVRRTGRPGADYVGVTVGSLRQGFVLLDGAGEALGTGVLNSDRRGAPYAGVLDGQHRLTGHWPAPELTLPKLLAVQHDEPARWAATARVLFVHDWLLWRMTGVQATELSYACAGAMADVAGRRWANDLLEQCGVGADRLAPLVEAGRQVGRLGAGWGLPVALPVVSGCGDTQLAAMGVGGLGDGVVTVVAGSSTPVQVATAAVVDDPLGRPWVSTHAAFDRWAAEGNAGYPGTVQGWWAGLVPASADEPATGPSHVTAVTAAPYWSRQTWERKPPTSLLGLRPETTARDVADALEQAHAYAVRGNIEDLERALRRPASAVVVTGGAAADGRLPALLARVLGRDVHWASSGGAAQAGTVLVARALGAHLDIPALPTMVLSAGDQAPWQEGYERWIGTTEALRSALGG